MISKCENIVINRTKFSEFSDFDPATEGVNGLKLVGYIDNIDGKRNISIDYGALLKKDGEVAPLGQYVRAGAIGDYTFISKNELCGELSGFKIDASDLEFIEIDWSNSSPELHITNGYLPISFAHSSYSLGQECILFLHNVAANICIYMPILGAENAIYNEIDTKELAGHTVNALIIFTKVVHAIYGEVMIPTRVFVGEDNKAFHIYAPTITKEEVVSPVARMFPASNANLDAVAMRVSELEKVALDTVDNFAEVEEEFIATNNKIDSKFNDLKDSLDEISNATAADLSKVLHVQKFASIDELVRFANTIDTKELSRLIALVNQGEEGVYAEFICLHPEKEVKTNDDFHLLGNASSIFATDEAINQHGSVVLVANVDENTFNSEKYGKISNTTNSYIAANGYALSPIALVDIYKKHKATQELIKATENGVLDEVSKVRGDMDIISNNINIIFDELKLDDDQTSDVSSRIDILEDRVSIINEASAESIRTIRDAIGLDGCHDGCTCEDKNACSASNKCTILCRIADTENDIFKINKEIISTSHQIGDILYTIEQNNTALVNLADATQTKFDEKDSQISSLTGEINKNRENITATTIKTDANTARLGDIYTDLVAVKGKLDIAEQENIKINGSIDDINKVIMNNGIGISSNTASISGIQADLSVASATIGENKHNISEISTKLHTIEKSISDINDTLTHTQTLVSSCNSNTNTAIIKSDEAKYTASEAKETALNAESIANKAVDNSAIAQKAAEDSLQEVRHLMEHTQKAHTFLLNYINGNNNGIYDIFVKDIFGDLDESSLYNVSVIETRVDNNVIYPSVSYSGEISSDGGDNRRISVMTEMPNEHISIIIHAYARALHVREM